MFNTTTKNGKKAIFLDVDDTIADTRAAIARIYESVTGDMTKSIFDTKSKKYCDFCPLWTDEEIGVLFTLGTEVYEEAQPILGAVEGVKYLIDKGYDIYITTMNHPLSIADKQKWIEKYFPDLKDKVYYIHWDIPNKDVFEGYAIIDDDVKNVATNNSYKPILLDFYGLYEKDFIPRDVIYCKNWKEVMSKL